MLQVVPPLTDRSSKGTCLTFSLWARVSFPLCSACEVSSSFSHGSSRFRCDASGQTWHPCDAGFVGLQNTKFTVSRRFPTRFQESMEGQAEVARVLELLQRVLVHDA